jgi:NAD(P)-dependent dehydrogenase (short-subunit alcohol dehydrogenase family)
MGNWFQGEVALVTGAGSGLGRASAITFAREGAKVVVGDIDVESGQQTVQMIEKAGGQALFVKVDVTKEIEVKMLIDKAIETYGGLHCAHNNVGMEYFVPLTECTEADWDHFMDLNLKSVWLCMKYEIKHMVKHGGGAIVNSSSIAGLVGAANSLTYVTSKHGVNGLTKVAAAEYGKMGIRVNAVCPIGMEGTGMHRRIMAKASEFAGKVLEWVPLGRSSHVQEVAEVVVWLCSKSASFVTGLPMPVDGGFTSM